MGCLAEVWASEVGVHFERRKEAQKYLIEFILTHGNYDLKALAEILDVSPLLLSQVVSGFSYLEDANALRLYDWFFLFIGE
ncbi:hypothetical protein [Legionella fallonii]|uniref:HTH araC/xylS-type domain-containing protein n=1 Tax=Legionella fallonii LLAP-10 TaxID=1212491 RepID=A0A098G790_9GAMM|nr:hypothetical protein [Legionella fallonii]CEG57866.1 conserved protein of unknown function [Legionella fallonii LLAP-10]